MRRGDTEIENGLFLISCRVELLFQKLEEIEKQGEAKEFGEDRED